MVAIEDDGRLGSTIAFAAIAWCRRFFNLLCMVYGVCVRVRVRVRVRVMVMVRVSVSGWIGRWVRVGVRVR